MTKHNWRIDFSMAVSEYPRVIPAYAARSNLQDLITGVAFVTAAVAMTAQVDFLN
jgi:hypothetical protein